MKEDRYRAECSNRFELVSIEQAKAQGTSYMIVHVVTENDVVACSMVDSGAQ